MSAALSPVRATDAIRVMVVDDSVVIRSIVARWLGETPGFEVVASHRNGRAAVEDVARARPHVIVLDIEMPEMDGVEALPLLLKAAPGAAVLMASTLTRRSAEVSLRCLSLGAADYVTKPEALAGAQDEYRRELVAKIAALGETVRRREQFGDASRSSALRAAARRAERDETVFPKRALSAARPAAIAIGASTGGPKAVEALLCALGSAIDAAPVLVTQHMPPVFTAIFAEQLARATGRPAREAADGETLVGGTIYVAPGGRHLQVTRSGGLARAKLDDGPPENFCRPAVDVMFRTAAAAYGPGLLAVVLTGMGTDGAKGALAVAGAGGTVLAQDEATSTVWGMPGAAAAAGACAAVLPLQSLGPKIVRMMAGDTR